LAWGFDALQDADDPRASAKEQGCSSRSTQDKTWASASLWPALLSCYQLLTGMAYFPPKFRIRIFEVTGVILSKREGVGTIFGLLVHVLPGPNKQCGFEPGNLLSWIRRQNN
jgi:hypothetical protein